MQKRNPEILEFCDLSYDLDTRLRFIADLAQAARSQELIFEDCISEFGNDVLEYLGRRMVLEHVFFGRSLRFAQLETQKLKAELWRLQKIRAGLSLGRRTRIKSGKRARKRILTDKK